MLPSPSERFLAEAVARGTLTPAQADDCRRLRAATAEVGIDLAPDEIAVRKGFVPRERADEILRALSRLRVGRYEVLERVGEGGAGVVWKARDTASDRIVALKLLSPEARREPEWRDRFLREARVALALNHPHVVRGIDCGESDGYLYFAMEFVEGGSVADRLRREGRLPERDALRIVRDVVRALEHVQSRGIVHRDLKPENLLLAADGSVKVGDLGLARPMREEVERGNAGDIAGTPLYISPEQVRDPARVDWRSDVYNLGATLFHMLAGRPPFPFERGRDVLRRHLEEIPPSPREFALDVSSGAAAVTLKMLQKDPADRYATLAHLAEDLESALAGRPPLHTVTFAPKPGTELDPSAARAASEAARDKRRWLPVAAGTAIAVVGLAVTAGLALWMSRASGAPGVFSEASRNVDVRAELARRAPDGPPTVERSAQDAASVDPPPSPGAVPPEGPRRALAAAERISREHPDDLAARRDAWRFVVERHAGTPEAAVAAERLRGVVAEAESAAEREFASRSQRAGPAEAAGRLGTAIVLFEDFPAELRDTPAGRRAETEVRRLGGDALVRLRRLLDESRALVAQDRHAEAAAKLDEAFELRLPEAQRDLAHERRDLERAAASYEARRDEQRARFERVVGAALLEAGSRGVEAALAALDAAAPEIPAWRRDVDALREVILRIPQAEPAPGPASSPQVLGDSFFAQLALGRIESADALRARLRAAGTRMEEYDAAFERVRAVLVAAAEDHLVLAEQDRAAKRPDEAAEHVRLALSRVPGYPRARVVEATLLADAGRPEAAIDVLVEVLSGIDPPATAHLRLGQVLATRPADADRARREIELFLALAEDGDPLRAEARASLEALQGRRTEALLRDLREALRRARSKDDAAATIESAEAILQLAPEDPEALLAVGETYPEVGRVRDGWRALRRIVDAGGAGPVLPKANRALRRLEERWAATRATRDDAAAARTLLEQGDVEAARERFDAVLVAAPFLEEALLGAAEVRLRRRPEPTGEGVRTARALLDDLVARNPESLRGREVRAEAMLAAGDAAAALAEAQAALSGGSLRPEPATTAGYAALRLDRTSVALEHFRESLARRRTARALLGRALAWIAQRDFANARAEMDMLVREFAIPEDLDAEVRAVLARLDMEVVEEDPGRTGEK